MKTILPALLLTAPFALGDTHFSGTVRNTGQQPIADLTLHFYRRLESGFKHRTAVTAPNGSWRIDLPDGEWRGATHTDDVLARGYFCMPGFVWCGEPADVFREGPAHSDFGCIESDSRFARRIANCVALVPGSCRTNESVELSVFRTGSRSGLGRHAAGNPAVRSRLTNV